MQQELIIIRILDTVKTTSNMSTTKFLKKSSEEACMQLCSKPACVESKIDKTNEQQESLSPNETPKSKAMLRKTKPTIGSRRGKIPPPLNIGNKTYVSENGVSRKRNLATVDKLAVKKKKMLDNAVVTTFKNLPDFKKDIPQRKSKLVPIGQKKYITIRKYCGRPQINIRDYSADSCGKLYSTKRGIMLSPEEWVQLKNSVYSVDMFLKEREMKEKSFE